MTKQRIVEQIIETTHYLLAPHLDHYWPGMNENNTNTYNILRRLESRNIIKSKEIAKTIKVRYRRPFYKGDFRLSGDSDNLWKHRYMVIEAAVAFAYHFLDYEVEIYYETPFKGKTGWFKADFLLVLHKGENSYYFIVELERSRTQGPIFKNTVEKYEQSNLVAYKKNHTMPLYQLPPHTKILIITADSETDPFKRVERNKYLYMPESMGDFTIAKGLAQEIRKHKVKHNYLTLPYSHLPRLNECLWYAPDGNRARLV